MINEIIRELFESRWCGESVLKNIDTMREQLYKTLKSQLDGYWSGHTAYNIAIDGGFLKDAKHGEKKELTAFGQRFVDEYEAYQDGLKTGRNWKGDYKPGGPVATTERSQKINWIWHTGFLDGLAKYRYKNTPPVAALIKNLKQHYPEGEK